MVKELAGHKDVSTTQRYAHLNQDQLKEAVGVLNYQGFIKVDQNEAMMIL